MMMMMMMMMKGITQFYLPTTHEPYLPLLRTHQPQTGHHHPLAGTHCAYPQRDGQAELTWVGGYILITTEPNRRQVAEE